MDLRKWIEPYLETLAGDVIRKLPDRVAKPLARELSVFAAPFRKHLRPTIQVWDEGACELVLDVKSKWRVRSREIHSGVVATLGEMAASLVLRRRLKMPHLKIALREMNFIYHAGVGTRCSAYSELSLAEADAIRKRVLEGTRTLVTMETVIRSPAGETLVSVRTIWQLSRE